MPSSTLTLLVARIAAADDAHNTLATHHLAVPANLFYGCANFHVCLTLFISRASTDATGTTMGFEVGFLHYRVVLVRHHVALHLRHEVHHYNDHNQQ